MKKKLLKLFNIKTSILILSLIFLCHAQGKKVILLPFSYMATEAQIFYKDGLWEKLKIRLKEKRGLDLRLYSACKPEEEDIIVSFNIHDPSLELIRQLPNAKHILYIFEPPTVDIRNHDKNYHQNFQKIFTWRDDLVDNKKYFKFYLPMMLNLPENLPNFKQRKLCCTVLANKHSTHQFEIYSERRSIINFFDKNHNSDFDLYGQGWSRNEFSCYRGAPANKEETIKKYKFCVCYENTKNMNGCVTEKIFECLSAGSVPIYLGAPNIETYVPKNCFIDRRDFNSNQEMYNYLKNMPEQAYNQILENIYNFLKTEQANLYSWGNFIEIFVDGV